MKTSTSTTPDYSAVYLQHRSYLQEAKSKAKVLFLSKILDSGGRYGGEYWSTLSLYKALESLGLEIWILHHSPAKRYSSHGREFTLSSIARQSDLLMTVYHALTGPNILGKIRPNIIHLADASLANAVLTLGFPGVKKVATITDVTPLVLPQFFTIRFKLFLNLFAKYARHYFDMIITLSESSAKDLCKVCGIPRNMVAVVHRGIESIFRELSNTSCLEFVAREYGIKERYILYVGSANPNKNLANLIESYIYLTNNLTKPPPLVLVGPKVDSYVNSFLRARQIGKSNMDNMRTLGYVPRNHLPYIYGAAKVFVFPSLHEGFGRPPLEAMACGTPVVASDIPVFRELLGEAALYVRPTHPPSVAEAIETLIADEQIANELKNRGLERTKYFSWEHAATQMQQIYSDLLLKEC